VGAGCGLNKLTDRLIAAVVDGRCSDDDSTGDGHTGSRTHLYADDHRPALQSSLASQTLLQFTILVVTRGLFDVPAEQQQRQRAKDHLSTSCSVTKLKPAPTRPARHPRLEAE